MAIGGIAFVDTYLGPIPAAQSTGVNEICQYLFNPNTAPEARICNRYDVPLRGACIGCAGRETLTQLTPAVTEPLPVAA